jgi:hypothetical protein
MNSTKLATAAVLVALPVSAIAAPSAVARTGGKRQGAHHLARPGRKAHRASHKRHTVSFTARVVRSSASGLVVRTPDGRVLTFSKKQIKPVNIRKHRKHRKTRGHGRGLMRAVDMQLSSGNVVVNLLGLQPGILVQITESTDPDGTVTITITLPAPSGEEQASGVVTEVDSDAFAVQVSDGDSLLLHMASDALANLNLQSCQTVDVTYHQDAGLLIADNVQSTGASSTGDCAPSYDASGVISQVTDGSVTISSDQGALTFNVDPASGLADGYQAGDLVDVTYTKADDGSLNATDIEFVEEDASGQVTAVTTSASGGSLTITDGDTGQSETFSADPSNGVQINARAFNGVSVGDQIDVTYHQSAGQLIADTVTDQ